MDAIGKLRFDAWRTSGARYNAARRLRRRSFVATASLAFFSATMIVISLVQSFYVDLHGPSALGSYLTTISGCISVFLLAVSLIEWGFRSGEKSDNLHRNAESLNGFQRRLGGVIELDKELSLSRYIEESRKYEEIKSTCLDNHDPLDDELFVSQHRLSPEFLLSGKPRFGKFRAFFISFRHFFSSIWYFLLIWVGIGFSIYCAPW